MIGVDLQVGYFAVLLEAAAGFCPGLVVGLFFGSRNPCSSSITVTEESTISVSPCSRSAAISIALRPRAGPEAARLPGYRFRVDPGRTFHQVGWPTCG